MKNNATTKQLPGSFRNRKSFEKIDQSRELKTEKVNKTSEGRDYFENKVRA